MSGYLSNERTDKDFPEALRGLMKTKGFSFPKLAREIGQKFSTTYIHNLASGKSRPTKENIEAIAGGLKVKPEYFKEYREYKAKEKIERNPEIADFIIDEDAAELATELADLTREQRRKVVDLVRELKARYETDANK